jgi:hypothetical protein
MRIPKYGVKRAVTAGARRHPPAIFPCARRYKTVKSTFGIGLEEVIQMETFACPVCSAAVQPDSLGGLRCSGCGAVLAAPQTLCPRCGRVNETGASVCAQCGEELTAACRGCGRVNWSGAEHCAECGRELDPLAHAFRPVNASFEARRQTMVQNVSSFREKEERESQARLETLRAADRRRAQRSAELAERARKRDQRIITGIGITLLVFAVLVGVVMLIIY